MDAVDERDVYLQRTSASLLSELELSLPKLLFRHDYGQGDLRLRQQVRVSTAQELINLLEPFQESPQLLDPRLHTLLSPLVQAFLLCVSGSSAGRVTRHGNTQAAVMPARRAICKLLYTLCKIRGPKTIARFVTNEANLLEPMLNTFQSLIKVDSTASKANEPPCLVWEEKYIFLLWLSHLLLTPFDLDSIGSSEDLEYDAVPASNELPLGTPFIASRLLKVSTDYLAAAGKEREAAVKVLVRLCLRPDMLRVGLYGHIIHWALTKLRTELNADSEMFPWDAIGYLSFLAGLASASDALTIVPFLLHIFKQLQSFVNGTSPESKQVISSAVARKVIVKIYRAISVSAIQSANTEGPLSELTDYILEEVIDHLLTALADKDTPVRYAASKAISIIAAKLPPSLRADIIDAVVGGLGENILKDGEIESERKCTPEKGIMGPKKPNLSSVNPLRWHGLVLSLSQLLFQRSPTPLQLPPILESLILALGFEQRSSSGTSIGTNVRDAACFGIWSIARRYTTTDLLEVDTNDLSTAVDRRMKEPVSILQFLATELAAAATLDPSGNIRRGASAALQELIGRHPDQIVDGISLVQIIDYHAVALRNRALNDVAVAAAKLHAIYWTALLKGMLTWRGIEAADSGFRRLAASAIGPMCRVHGIDGIGLAGEIIFDRLVLEKRQVIERRHGLLLAGASVIQAFMELETATMDVNTTGRFSRFWLLLGPSSSITDGDLKHAYLRPELTAEAICCLMSTLARACSGPNAILKSPSNGVLDYCVKLLHLCLIRREDLVIAKASQAAKDLFGLLSDNVKSSLLSQWNDKLDLSVHGAGAIGGSLGFMAALGTVYTSFTTEETDHRSRILTTILFCIRSESNTDIETKVAALQSLRDAILQSDTSTTSSILESLEEALQDYTTDQRGDVGSLVRLEALNAVRAIIRRGNSHQVPGIKDLVAIICTLAAEKLDKVRYHAWRCMYDVWDLLGLQDSDPSTFIETGDVCSTKYYTELFSLLSISWLRLPLAKGLITSVGSGSESVLRVSRASLSMYLQDASDDELRQLAECFMKLLVDSQDQERLVVPALETWAFLLQSNCLLRLEDGEFRWRRLFNGVQKAHYKSGNVKKLSAAVEVYAGLASIPSIRGDVLRRLASLLLHPLPKIRNAAADSLYLCTQDGSMMVVNWSQAPTALRPIVDTLMVGMEGSAC